MPVPGVGQGSEEPVRYAREPDKIIRNAKRQDKFEAKLIREESEREKKYYETINASTKADAIAHVEKKINLHQVRKEGDHIGLSQPEKKKIIENEQSPEVLSKREQLSQEIAHSKEVFQKELEKNPSLREKLK